MLTSVGLFSGIGGFEHAFARQGFHPRLLCEIAPDAGAVLRARFPDVRRVKDVRNLQHLPYSEVLTAGFPCQNLSQVGPAKGIRGRHSSLIYEVFRLLRGARRKPTWIVLENVPFMLNLRRGQAMRVVISALSELGYTWAYRVIDARAFGLPQRRRRVFIVASNKEDPRGVLLESEKLEVTAAEHESSAFGFYWTEGNTGIGWAPNCIPALKSGSSISIPSSPAIWVPAERSISTPDIRDAERLQGFKANWTKVQTSEGELGRSRWKLVGNAIPVPIAEWIAERIQKAPDTKIDGKRVPLDSNWGMAGWGHNGHKYMVERSEWPVSRKAPPLLDFLAYPRKPLSARATKGFYTRLKKSSLKTDKKFLVDLGRHSRSVE